MNKERLTYLFRQHCLATATAAERSELMDALRIQTYDDTFKEVMDEYIKNEGEEIQLDEVAAGEMLEAVFDAGRSKIMPVVRPAKRYIARMAIAASIILFIATGAVYFMLQRQKSPAGTPVTADMAHKDLLPGRSGAILRLSNGKTIVLDTAANGKLYNSHIAAVIKAGDAVSIAPSGHNGAIEYNLLTTPRGRQQEIVLSDGTKVWLNAASSLRFPTVFTGNERMVEITGEAYFEVKHNRKAPFKIKAAGQVVEDVGTAFNINAYSDENAVRTTLIEGSVMVSAALTTHPSLLTIHGQQAVVKGSRIDIADKVDVEEVIAWKNGLFKFHGADIGTIIRQAGRWYDVDIEIRDNITTKFDGEIERNVNASQLLQILELTGKVHFEIKDKKIIVKR